MKSRRSPALFVLLALLAGCGSGDAAAIGSSSENPPPTSSPSPDGGGRASSRTSEFVADADCVECHEYATERWTGSYHDLAIQPASEATVLGDFDDALFEHRGVETRFFRRDGGFWIRTEGPNGEPAEYRVEYVFGVDPLQQVLVPFPGGRMQCLTVAWDTVEGRWFSLYPDDEIGPDDELHWTGRYQNWNLMCAECHSTDLVKGYDPEADAYSTTWRELDVGCQACHGPGAEHVAWAEARDPDAVWMGNEDARLVVQLRREGAREQMNACSPCHSRRHRLTSEYAFGSEYLDHFVPELLREGSYHPDGQVIEEVYVYGSFLQSKMHAQGVACTDCHEPHSLELLSPGNGVCTQCHSPDADTERFETLQAKEYDTPDHHFHEQGAEGSLCVDCHMRSSNFMVVDPRRDHSLRIPRPDLTLAIGTPNACDDCHADEGAAWAEEHVREWYGPDERPLHYGLILAGARAGMPEALGALAGLVADPDQPAIVRATALELLAGAGSQAFGAIANALYDEDPLVRRAAVDGLDRMPAEARVQLAAPLLDDPVRAVRVEAARVLAAVPPSALPEERRAAHAAALAEWREAQEINSDQPWALLNLGVVAAESGRMDEAVEDYRRALELDPLFLPATFNLANVLNRLGRNEEAEEVLRAGAASFPDEGEVFYSLGLLLAEMGKDAEAAEFLERTGVLLPDRPRVHKNRGLLLQRMGRFEDAEAALLLALKWDDRDPEVLHALTNLYVERGEWERALPYAERFAETVPGAPVARELLARVRGELESE